MSKISICIPTYGMKGKGSFYLQKNLSSIFIQTNISEIEVIISDHSTDNLIEKTASKWSEFLPIKYYRNEYMVGCISSNLNNCIEKSTGDVIDFMLQDDYYTNPWSLRKRVENLGDRNWGLTSTLHHNPTSDLYYWHLIPTYRNDIYLGFNSIGSPSLLTMKNNKEILFDETLFMLTDCDYYKQLFDKYGMPFISNEITVITTIWEGQSQNEVSNEKKEKEIQLVKNKYEKR